RVGPITTLVMRRMRLVAPAAIARTARGSRDLATTRSVTTRLENGPRSARVAHSSINSPEIPTIRLGKPSATRMKPPTKKFFRDYPVTMVYVKLALVTLNEALRVRLLRR